MILLDIKYDSVNNQIVKWIKDKDCNAIREIYYPKIYVSDFDSAIPIISSLPGVKSVYYEEKLIYDTNKEERVLCITLDANRIYDITSILEQKCKLYNIDVDIIRQYLLEHKIFPFDNNKDDQYSIDYTIPELKCIYIKIIQKKNYYNNLDSLNNEIECVYIKRGNIDNLDDIIILGGTETEILYEFNKEINDIDPDIIFTDNGDSFELPYLLHRSSLYNIKLNIGREKDIFDSEERSYFSYGRILYKPAKYILSGRLHIDRSYFLVREGGIKGLIDLSRITCIGLQEISRLSPGSAVTALQINQAMRDNILIPRKRHNTEYWKTAEELLIADRGALVLEPKIGIHEEVFELDFASLFPNIMVKHNISPETVLCSCCPNSEKKVPFIGYNICQKQIGLIPRVLKPVIERRMEYKRRSKLYKYDNLKRKEYDNMQNILKWLLVTSFGYMGFNKAIFGRIECHESITAYAREILLRSIEIANDMGYEILHGIVDCLWVKGKEPEELCEVITRDVGINLELKGKFDWIVFLPNKTNNAGSLNRYYGVMTDGKLKIRGIETRRSDTPLIVKNLQSEMLTKLAEAKNISEFYLKIPESIKILKKFTEKVISNGCDLNELILQINISRECDEYLQFNNQVAALKQLREEGIEIKPGQFVRYIITDHRSKDYQKRIILPEFIDNNTKYDKIKYYQYLLKGAESILLPFGYNEKILDNIIRNKIQTNLSEF